MLSTLLIPLDGSALAERALPYAAYLARATGAHVLLLHAPSDLAPLTRMEAECQVKLTLDPHIKALRRSGIEAASRAAHGLPDSAILSAVREDRVDLIVMSTHGRGGIGRWLHGSVADEVLRRAGVPVLLVSPTCDRRWEDDRPFRMLVPVDGSLHSERALGSARELAESLRAELLLVRAIEDPAPESYRYGEAGYPVLVPEGEGELNEARQYLEGVAGKAGSAFASIDVLADVGEAARVIGETAGRGSVDLIVMATHGRTGLERLTLGSIATQVLQHAPVPVMLVRPAALAGASDESRWSVALDKGRRPAGTEHRAGPTALL